MKDVTISNRKTYQTHDDTQRQYPCILPPHAPSDRLCTTPESSCLVGHIVRLIYQQLDPLSSRKYLLDVLHHDILDLREFRLGARELVGGRGGVVGGHEGGDGGAEGALEGGCGG